MSNEYPQPVRGLRKFQIRFDEGPGGERTIYANSRMQVRVLVTLSGTGTNDEPAWLPASITNTVRLIDYNTGALLDDNWQVSERPNLFSRVRFNLAEDYKSPQSSDPAETIREYWICAKAALGAKIGARVNFQGDVVRTNKTGAVTKFDSYVLVKSEPPVLHDFNSFRLDGRQENVGGFHEITRSYVSLNVNGVKVGLLGWVEKSEAAHFEMSQTLNVFTFEFDWHGYCWLAAYDEKRLDIPLPEYEGVGSQFYSVEVNDRSGELSVVLGTAKTSGFRNHRRIEDFLFVAYDVYGTAHPLKLRCSYEDLYSAPKVVLERG